MLQFEELKLRLVAHEEELSNLAEALGLEKMKKEIANLEEQAAQDGFWDDIQNSQKVLQRTSGLKNKVAAYEKLKADFEDALVMIELADEEGDESLVDECTESVENFEKEVQKTYPNLKLCHRLDTNTSGLLVLAEGVAFEEMLKAFKT